jgi:hypothetical protein
METYPDAAVIWVHRDPVEASWHAASSQSAYEAAKLGLGDATSEDTSALAARMLDSVSEYLSHALSDPRLDRVHHVGFADLVEEPVETVRRIYQYAGFDFGEGTRRSLTRWISDPVSRPGEPSSSAVKVGRIPFSAARQRDALIEYGQRFRTSGQPGGGSPRPRRPEHESPP